MNKLFYKIFALGLVLMMGVTAWAGNPDRQGEAGAYELLMNPWARSAGLHTMTTSMITGVEALRLNPAGLSRINQTEILVSNAIYLQGTGINMNAAGFAQRVGNGAIGVSLMSLDFGDIPVTTTDQPEGTGTTFSPAFFHIGLSYSYTFENKVSVGLTFRGISESIQDLNAFGIAIDAGVQYVTGPKDNFKFGISLRNVGSRMRFGGQGLAVQRPSPNDNGSELTFNQRAEDFEIPSVLNLGLSYDFLFGPTHRLTVLGNFTANSFSQDQIGGGVEYSLKEIFMIRGGYKYEVGSEDPITAPIYEGLSAGASVEIPLSKENKNLRLGIDYAYRQTRVWNGTHNFSVRINI
ncbi:MAG: PorV/PorQ family protein [Bacteroidota bacterium]